MLKKLVAVLIATLFSLSVVGPSLAAEENKPGTPATPAKKEAAANPCEGAGKGEKKKKEEKKTKKTVKKTAKKKTAKKKSGEVPGPVEK